MDNEFNKTDCEEASGFHDGYANENTDGYANENTDTKGDEAEREQTVQITEAVYEAETEEQIKKRVKSLQKKAQLLPPNSGVYLMKSKTGKIIYVGKARILIRRVSQYFVFYPHNDAKTNKLVENIHDFDFIITGTEVEALILENQMIKLHTPKYNIKLKDDKNYPYIKIDVNSPFPKIAMTRARVDDKAAYFGPYSNKGNIYSLIDEINRHFKLPTCKNEFPRDIKKYRPCLNHRISRCLGVCTGDVKREDYREIIDNVLMFIKGDYEKLIREYDNIMKVASEELDFEKAALYRDKKFSLQKLRDKQKIVAAPNVDKDVFGVYVGDTSSCVSVLNIRYGVMVDKISEHFSYDEILDADGFTQYIQSYYSTLDFVPKNIILSLDIGNENTEILEKWLDEKIDSKVNITIPKKGENKTLSDLAVTNSRESQRLYKEKYSKDTNKLISIAKLLSLDVVPDRIEAYDISNSGSDIITCGMIVIEEGAFKKSEYKSFNIKNKDAPDDYASMSEAISRRFKDRSAEKNPASFGSIPDLILLDGGRGHVSAIRKVLADNNIDIPLFGMVKDEFHKTRVLTDGESEINIAKDQSVFVFFYKIQEEVHRFSIKRMDTQRRKTVKKSALEEIKGLGAVRIKNLLQHFKNIESIKNADTAALSSVKGITAQNASEIKAYFENKDKEQE